MKTIPVQTGKPYSVHIGNGLLDCCGQYMPGKPGRKAAVITDDNVRPLYARRACQALQNAGYAVTEYVFPHGEEAKSMATVLEIVSFLTQQYFTRNDFLVALGGGVVGDTVGFAASIYQRGIEYMQIPTTFLAAIDSSVGGKTAVNIPQGKNLVGTFWQPRTVVCDIDTLSTLDAETFADGVAEAIKYGCIWDKTLFSLLETGDLPAHLEEIIARCVEIKADVVSQDEREGGLRQILNFGHTLGHAIEKESHFAVSHGRGVAIGMYCAARAGERAGITPAGTAARLAGVLGTYGLPTQTQYPLQALCRHCLGDKKRSGDSIGYVLLKELGSAFVQPVSADALEDFLHA